MKKINVGDVVRHFKYETLTDEEKKKNKYLYVLKGFGQHTETNEILVIYQALYEPFQTYCRPLEDFCSEVDHVKYPDIKQERRFIKHNVQPCYEL